MAKVFAVILVYIVTLCITGIYATHNESTTEFVFTIVGLYSECLTNSNAENRTEMNRLASLARRYVDTIPYGPNISNYKSCVKIDVRHYDMCSEKENDDVMKIIVNIMLDEDFFFQEPGEKYKTSNIGAFFVFMTDDLTARFKSLVHGIPIFNSNMKEILPNEYQLYSNFILKLARLFHWNKLMFFFLEDSDHFFYREYRSKCMETFREEYFCVYQKDIRADGKIDNETKIWLFENRPTIVLFCLPKLQEKFFSVNADLLNDLELQVFFHDLSTENITIQNKYTFVFIDQHRSALNLEWDVSFLPHIPTDLYIPAYFRIGFQNDLWLKYQSYFFSVCLTLTMFKGEFIGHYRLYKTLLQRASHSLSSDDEIASVDRFIDVWFGESTSDITYIDHYSEFEYLLPFLMKNKLMTVPSNCTEVSCPPGSYKTYGNVTMGFAWKCEPCPVNYHKSNYGNTACLPCIGLKSVDNGKRTACVDPYEEVLLESSSERYFVIAVCGIGLLTTLTTLIVFILKRNTPIVTLCDFKLSLGHMILILLIFIGVLFSLLIHPIMDSQFCVLKLVLVSIGYTLNVTIVFIKSQKILQAFFSKVRLTSQEIKRSIILQIFIVLMFLIFINGALSIAVVQKPIEILEIRDSLTKTRLYTCSTHSHVSLIMGLTMILQLLCSIQAYRGRHLPSVMNDGITLMYTTFALVVCFGATFAMVQFQKVSQKEVFQFGGVATNNLVISFLLYGQKAVRMLVFPERNTAAYFREQRMAHIQQRAQESIPSNHVQ